MDRGGKAHNCYREMAGHQSAPEWRRRVILLLRLGFMAGLLWPHLGYGRPKEHKAGAFFAKDDGIAVWVNDEKVLDDNTWSHYQADHLIATLPLKEGWNKVLVKNCNWLGCWAWHMRLTDPNGELKISNTFRRSRLYRRY